MLKKNIIMRHLKNFIIIFIAFLLTGCNEFNDVLEDVGLPTVPTIVFTLTSVPTETFTETPTGTNTPTNTPIITETPTETPTMIVTATPSETPTETKKASKDNRCLSVQEIFNFCCQYH